jgi:hypothetical protein
MSNKKRKIDEEQEPDEREADTIKNENEIAADEGAEAFDEGGC